MFSIIASTPFRFLVGSNKRLFTVHAAAITHHSKPLGVLVNGDMSEAKESCAWLEDVDESTFIRFSQYAYTGDYIAADPEILLDSSTIANIPSNSNEPGAVASEKPPLLGSELLEPMDIPPAPAPAEPEPPLDPDLIVDQNDGGGWGSILTKPKMEVKNWKIEDKPKTEKLAGQFKIKKAGKRNETKTSTIPNRSFNPRKNRESCEDYTKVFLCHARLYAFAEKYDIAPLRKLSVNKLHQTLSVFTLYKERVGDIVALMRYSYENTVHRSQPDDPLRSLLIHYATCCVADLVPNSDFKELLEEPGELASDLVVKMINRLD